MSGGDLTPERLDGILDGSQAPNEETDRDMLALAAELRDAAPGAGDELRERVRAIAAQAPAHADPHRGGVGWRSRLLLVGPALATVVAALVVIVVVDGNGGSNRDLARRESALTSAAPAAGAPQAAAGSSSDSMRVAPPALAAGPVIVQVDTGTLVARVDEARRIVTRAGGTVTETPQSTSPPGTLLTITLPAERAAGAAAKLAALGEVSGGSFTSANGGSLRVLLTER
jgi:hypothetical protein